MTKADDLDKLKQRLKRAQESVRRYVKPGQSLADELIAERRAEARAEEERESQIRRPRRGVSKRALRS
jgi:hypothetical protein